MIYSLSSLLHVEPIVLCAYSLNSKVELEEQGSASTIGLVLELTTITAYLNP